MWVYMNEEQDAGMNPGLNKVNFREYVEAGTNPGAAVGWKMEIQVQF